MVAFIVAIFPRSKFGARAAWFAVLATGLACTAISLAFLIHVKLHGPVDYFIGGWTPPFGISYRIDGLSAPILFLISSVSVLCTIYALPSVLAEVEPKKRALFYATFLVSFAE